MARCLLAVCLAQLAGCASWSNPVANGLPVRLLPPELLAEQKENLETIPLTLLRQRPPEAYRLAAGDLLGVYIEGVLGQEGQIPPVNFPDTPDAPVPASIVVRDDGAAVAAGRADQGRGPDAHSGSRLEKAYTVQTPVLKTGEEHLVTLIRPPGECW
jgi:hypothetical protein